MREMKEGVVEYIESFPSTWKLKRLKYILRERNERSSTGNEELLSVSQYKGVIPSSENTMKTMSANSLVGYKKVFKGDLVFNKLNPGLARFGYSKYDGITSPDFAVYVANNKDVCRFLSYLLKTDRYVAYIKSKSTGVGDGFARLYTPQLFEFIVAMPNEHELYCILDEIDKKCGEIDEISGLIEKQIETLEQYKRSIITETVTKGLNKSVELVDSGIKWIGKIPLGWEKLKIKDGFIRKKAKALQEDPVVLSLARSGVKIRDISTNEGQLAASYYEYNPVSIDDMLLNPMDLQSGANCSISKVEGVISPAYINLRYKKGFNPRFYDYYFKIQYWSFAFFSYGKGVSFDNRWTLNEDTLMRLPLIVPPLEEQNAIADFLDKKCGEIDEIIADKKAQLENLSLYKKSLIYEYVTGKKEVAYE